MKSRLTPFLTALLLCALLLFPSSVVDAQGAIQITDTGPDITFPDNIKFSAHLRSDAPIQSAVLEYGVEQLTCGTVIAKAFPEFQKKIDTPVEWTWEMRQSGSLPPGAQIWWQWRVTDAQGRQEVSPRKTVTWLDDIHNWRKIDTEGISLHWYEGDALFGESLHAAAVKAMGSLEKEAGLSSGAPIDLYIYGSQADLRGAVLYEPSWIGGEAFPAQNIVIIGVSPDELEWGKRAIAHELTHVLVGHFTFSCLGDVPAWLDEGLATFSEGDLEPYSRDQFDEAVRMNTLIPLRALSGGFSEKPDQADLSYSESFSVVNFLIRQYGREKMSQLLTNLRDGRTINASLSDIYGFDVDGLEDVWRADIGAIPYARAEYTSTPPPTVVPTFKPVSGRPGVITSPTPRPTSSSSTEPTKSPVLMETSQSDSSPFWILLGTGLVCLVLFVSGAALLLILRRKRA
jgi:hypothetical protein